MEELLMSGVWILVKIELPADKFPFNSKSVYFVPRKLIHGNGGYYGLTNRKFFKKYFDDIFYRIELSDKSWTLNLYLNLKKSYNLKQVELGIRFRLRKILFGKIFIEEIKDDYIFKKYPKYFRSINVKKNTTLIKN